MTSLFAKILGIGKLIYRWITSPAGKATLKTAEAILPTLGKVADKEINPLYAGAQVMTLVTERMKADPKWAENFLRFQSAVDRVREQFPELTTGQIHAAIETGVGTLNGIKAKTISLASLAFLLVLPLASCTVIHGDATKGTYTFASLGGDAKGYAQTAAGVTAETLDNSTSFREGNKTLRQAIWASALEGTVNSIAGAVKSTTNAKTAAGLEATKSADAVKTAEIQAKTAETAILNPAPAP